MTEGTQPQQEPLVVAYQRESGDSLTKYDLGTLAVRLFGLYCLVEALGYAMLIPSLISMYRSPTFGGGGLTSLAAYCAPCFVFALAGTFMLARTRPVVRWAFPDFAAGTALSATGRDLQAVLFSVVGVWLVASGLPEAARLAAEYWWLNKTNISSAGNIHPLPQVIGVLVQLVAGVFLFARARGLSALWHRLRYAGVQQGPTP